MIEHYYDITEKEKEEVLNKVTNFIVTKGLTVPAIMYFHTFKPLSFIGSSLMVMGGPVAEIFIESFTKMNPKLYAKAAKLLENRDNVEILIQRIEKKDAEFKVEMDKLKKENRKKSRFWKFWSKLFRRNSKTKTNV